MAGSADSSPTSKCQSAWGSGVYPPPGPSKTRTEPGFAVAAQGPAMPSSPCTTKSTVRVCVASSQERTV